MPAAEVRVNLAAAGRPTGSRHEIAALRSQGLIVIAKEPERSELNVVNATAAI